MCFWENENCCFNKYRKPAFPAQLCCARVFLVSTRSVCLSKQSVWISGQSVCMSSNLFVLAFPNTSPINMRTGLSKFFAPVTHPKLIIRGCVPLYQLYLVILTNYNLLKGRGVHWDKIDGGRFLKSSGGSGVNSVPPSWIGCSDGTQWDETQI